VTEVSLEGLATQVGDPSHALATWFDVVYSCGTRPKRRCDEREARNELLSRLPTVSICARSILTAREEERSLS